MDTDKERLRPGFSTWPPTCHRTRDPASAVKPLSVHQVRPLMVVLYTVSEMSSGGKPKVGPPPNVALFWAR